MSLSRGDHLRLVFRQVIGGALIFLVLLSGAGLPVFLVARAQDGGSPPSKPTRLVSLARNEQIILSWDNPTNHTITKYQYQMKVGTGNYGDWTEHERLRRKHHLAHLFQLDQRHQLQLQDPRRE